MKRLTDLTHPKPHKVKPTGSSAAILVPVRTNAARQLAATLQRSAHRISQLD